jgi:AcrR family transcriptional regulator
MTRHKPRNERENQIIEAAVKCFSSAGYHKTTMDDIAKEVGLSKGSLYRYFKNKKQLFLEILNWYAEPWEEQLEQAISGFGTASEKLRMMIMMSAEVTLKLEMQELARITLDFYSAMRFDQEVNEALQETIEPLFQIFIDIVEEGIATGEFRKVNARQAGIAILGALDGMGIYAMMNVRDFNFLEATTAYIDIVLAGLKN